MKTIIKVLLISLIVIVLSQCKKEHYVNIPDNDFLNALIKQGVDKNDDDIISPSEAAEITYLDVSNCNISDLKGIEAFVNLEWLYCNDNQLNRLGLSNNPALKELQCGNNSIQYLNVSNNPALLYLYLYFNRLSGLNISNNHELRSLQCSANPLTSLDVSNNPALEELSCMCFSLTSLDVSNNPALIILNCFGSPITSLDLSNNAKIDNLILGDMPSLSKVCVWTMPFPPTGVTVDTAGSPNVYFTMDCSK
jgi:hypothetical protein